MRETQPHSQQRLQECPAISHNISRRVVTEGSTSIWGVGDVGFHFCSLSQSLMLSRRISQINIFTFLGLQLFQMIEHKGLSNTLLEERINFHLLNSSKSVMSAYNACMFNFLVINCRRQSLMNRICNCNYTTID